MATRDILCELKLALAMVSLSPFVAPASRMEGRLLHRCGRVSGINWQLF